MGRTAASRAGSLQTPMVADDYSAAPAAHPGPTQAFRIPASCAGLRLDQALARLMPEHSRSRIRVWIDAGRVTLAGAPANAKYKLGGGELVLVAPIEVTANETM